MTDQTDGKGPARMRRTLATVAAAGLLLGGCVACSSDQSTPCEATDRSIATDVAAEHLAHIDGDYPGKIISYCERGNSGTVEIFTTLGFTWSDSEAMTICRRVFNAATNSAITAPGLKRVVVRLSSGDKAASCGPD